MFRRFYASLLGSNIKRPSPDDAEDMTPPSKKVDNKHHDDDLPECVGCLDPLICRGPRAGNCHHESTMCPPCQVNWVRSGMEGGLWVGRRCYFAGCQNELQYDDVKAILENEPELFQR